MNDRLNIFWVTPEIPLPCINGHRFVYSQRIKGLISKGHRITLFTIIDSTEDLLGVEQMSRMGCTVHSSWVDKLHRQSGVYTDKPRHVLKRFIPELKTKITNLAHNDPPDIFIIDSLAMTLYKIDFLPFKPLIVYVAHNLDFVIYWRSFLRNLPHKLAYIKLIEAIVSLRYEMKIFGSKSYDVLSFLSIDEMAFIKKIYPNTHCVHLPIGIDCQQITTQKPPEISNIVFVGNMSYSSNIESVIWFIDRAYPIIEKALPNITIILIGNKPSKLIMNKVKLLKNIKIFKNVDDISTYLSRPYIGIAPIVSGAGVKVKILQYLAHRIPVVATSKAIQGFLNKDLLLSAVVVANSPTHFAKECIDLLNNKSKQDRMTQNGLTYVNKYHTMEEAVSKFETCLYNELERKRAL